MVFVSYKLILMVIPMIQSKKSRKCTIGYPDRNLIIKIRHENKPESHNTTSIHINTALTMYYKLNTPQYRKLISLIPQVVMLALLQHTYLTVH